jgi:hypothetical protein
MHILIGYLILIIIVGMSNNPLMVPNKILCGAVTSSPQVSTNVTVCKQDLLDMLDPIDDPTSEDEDAMLMELIEEISTKHLIK